MLERDRITGHVPSPAGSEAAIPPRQHPRFTSRGRTLDGVFCRGLMPPHIAAPQSPPMGAARRRVLRDRRAQLMTVAQLS